MSDVVTKEEFQQEIAKAVGLKSLPKMGLWRILILPRPIPRESAGGIALAGHEQGEMYSNFIGQVLDMGPLCFKNRTQGGVLMSDVPDDRACGIGDWIMYNAYSGKRIFPRKGDGQQLLIINDTDFEALIEDPGEWRGHAE